jgi:hypothetical protein
MYVAGLPYAIAVETGTKDEILERHKNLSLPSFKTATGADVSYKAEPTGASRG